MWLSEPQPSPIRLSQHHILGPGNSVSCFNGLSFGLKRLIYVTIVPFWQSNLSFLSMGLQFR